MGVISLDLQQTDAGANKWSYNWLTDLPSINGVTIQGDLTLEDLDIIIPTLVSELENDVGYITEEELGNRFYTKDEVYNKDEIDDKFDDIVIPTKVSELENDAGYITSAALTPYYTSAQVDSLVEAEAAQRLNSDTALGNRLATAEGNISTNTANIATNTASIATNAANIATNTANIATNTADIATNASAIATNTANIATNTANIATNASDIAGETDAREIADQNLQEQIDAIAASSDVVDIVGTYAALQAYDTSKLHDNDIIKVLDDETRNDATTYYRWSTTTSTWSYIGAEGPFYTKADADATFVPQTRTINSKPLSSNVTLTAQDVGALPDSTVIPTVNNATLTIQKNGSTVETFTANSSTNKTANITVPTKTSDLTNDGDGTSNFATETYVDTYGGKIDVIKVNGTAQTITNKTVDLTVPTKTSDLTNDSNFAVDANYVHTDNNFTTTLKNKLDGIASGAEVNQNAFSNVKVGSTTVSADSKTDTLELVAGSNVTLTPDATNDKVTIAATDTKYNDMTGATSSAAGTHGLVPAPAAGDNTKFLSGDGTWKTVSQYELPIASANTLGGVKIGENLSITNTGILSADAQQIDVDSALSTTSENPVQNKVITTALAGKTNTKRSYTTATTLNYKKITVVGGTYSTDGSGIILFTREERYIIDGMCASRYGGKCIELGTNHNASNTSATTSNRWVNIKVYGVPESRTTEIYCRMSPYTYVDVHSSGTITITDINEATWTAATNNATYIPLLGADTALSTTSVAPVQNKAVTTALNSKADTSSLAPVSFSGAYADLTGLPTIPVVNNATLTIQKNGSTVKTFTANASSNVTANITVPTATSELTNDSGFIDEIPVASAGTLGGIKVGSNLSINASGVLSADDCPVYTAENVAPTADTVNAWVTALGGNGVYFTWYTQSNKFTKQPSQYGFLMTIIGGNDIRQEWWTQTGGWHGVRTGNYSGWSSFSGSDGTFISMGAKIDGALSTTSANPVMNSVITNALNSKADSADIPTVNNATLTIQKNGTNVQTFTANQSTNATANITVPTKVSDLSNTSGGFITYCTCTTAAATATKTITVDSGDSNWTLRKGTVIAVRFTNTNTASNVKFDVGGSGAKSVYYNTGVNTGSSNSIFGYANRTVLYVYDGTNWVWLSDSRHDGNNDTYTTAYCSTAAGTAAKTASMTGYVLTANRYTVLTITNANTAASALTLNINGKGAKPLYINGAASSSTNYTLPAGSYIIWYDGTNYYIDTSGNIPRTVHPVDVTPATTPAQTITDNMVVDGTLTFAKTATGEFLKLQLSTVDIGEGASLAPNTLYGVYE